MQPVGIFHEHPDWFKPLFAELDDRGIPYERINPAAHSFAIDAPTPAYSLFFNRMSPSAYLRDGVQGIFYTLHYLKYLENHGIRVINGYHAFTYEVSKALQLMLLHSLGLPYPKASVVNHISRLAAAAEGLRYPVVVKANIGGSGAGITRYDTPESLQVSIDSGDISFGIDHTVLVQEYIPAREGCITRVETLGGKYLYAIRVFCTGDTFNHCPAINGLKVESYTPPPEVIKAVETIIQRSGIDVGGVEYIIDDRDGALLYYDVNALSNFVSNAVNVIGFNPHQRLVNYLEAEMYKASGKRQTYVGAGSVHTVSSF